MKGRLHLAILLITMVSLIGGAASAQAPAPTSGAAYVEPALFSWEAETLPVIVTASDSRAVVRAVEHVDGQVTSDLWLIDSVAATIPANQIKALAAYPGVRSIVNNKGVKTADWDGWVTDYRFPVPWDGRPDVQPTNNKKVWELVNPVAIDVGADVLHQTRFPDGKRITGKGITVAVVDTGVYFDKGVKKVLGSQVEKLFLGQADFVDAICDTHQQKKKTYTVGTQYDGYCLTDSEYSKDGYGHGTHVAGIVWNNFTDYATGVTMGIAPNANVLSVRVLGNDGYGTYEAVIKGIQYVVENKDIFNIRVLNLSLSAEPTTPYFKDPLNHAVERAWAQGIVVVAAAGNTGPESETITVPGNDPYVITVGGGR